MCLSTITVIVIVIWLRSEILVFFTHKNWSVLSRWGNGLSRWHTGLSRWRNGLSRWRNGLCNVMVCLGSEMICNARLNSACSNSHAICKDLTSKVFFFVLILIINQTTCPNNIRVTCKAPIKIKSNNIVGKLNILPIT